MTDKINETLKYYSYKKKGLMNFINGKDDLTVEEIIENAEELSILEYKITALQVALEN
ncbi:hypothetical protein N8273_02880 [Algibacter sp.]|nr:hypothetical protein [Algibacter sp.]MDA9069543.1 hypothetical protein [Algibacter sp.]MDC1365261.1 hypothetical protein [Algibacter sp.]MDC1379562.1 hypothetical protein [Algibacter sp.]